VGVSEVELAHCFHLNGVLLKVLGDVGETTIEDVLVGVLLDLGKSL